MPQEPVGRLHNTPVKTATGVLSYSIYLWQQPFLASHQVAWWARVPMSLVLTVAAATVSYFLIERPFLALRQLIQRRRTRVVPATA
jgi:peptidoglycan/LPS O-acetylase OafA/YrhL